MRKAQNMLELQQPANQPTVMTYFSNKENQTLTELSPVSVKKLFVPPPASVTTASSINARPVTPFSQFAV